jgi:hypothetical protein
LSQIRRSIATSLMSALLALSVVTACGGGKATATIVPLAPTATLPTATTITPLLLTPRASVTNGATSPSGSVGAASTGMVYTDPQGRFSFTVPDGYQQAPLLPQQSDVVARFMSQAVSGVLLVNIQNMEPGATLELKTEVTQKAASKFPGYQALTAQPTPVTVAGQPGREFEFLLTENGGRIYHTLLVTTVRGNDFYTLNIEIEEKDFAANVEQAKTFINTFAFLGSG